MKLLSFSSVKGALKRSSRKLSDRLPPESVHLQQEKIAENCCSLIRTRTTSMEEWEDATALSTLAWYWPHVSGVEAVRLLKSKENGCFLVRRSSTPGYYFTVTYKLEGQVGSLRVQCKDGLFSLKCNDPHQPTASTLKGLVDKWLVLSQHKCVCGVRRERDGVTEAIPFKLSTPIHREITLKDRCRQTLIKNIDKKDIDKLNLPLELVDFLQEF